MNKRKILTVISAFYIAFLLCGAGWFNRTKVVIDTEKNRVYQYCTVDTLISAFTQDDKEARKTYKDNMVLLAGKVSSIGKNGKDLVLTGITSSDMTVKCSYDKELRTVASDYGIGDSVALYGKITVDAIDKDIHLKAEKIMDMPPVITSNEMFYLLDGSSFDKRNANKITLHNGDVEYYIPASWASEDIQSNITDEKLGTMEGYQYRLNRLEVNDSDPESLFICYFDNQKQLADYLNDSEETELIEKAIVDNILGDVGSFPSKEVDTYYGSEYDYYLGSYKKKSDTVGIKSGSGYHVEFIFQADGKEGIVVMLYVYKETKHLSDIMFVSRFLEIK